MTKDKQGKQTPDQQAHLYMSQKKMSRSTPVNKSNTTQTYMKGACDVRKLAPDKITHRAL